MGLRNAQLLLDMDMLLKATLTLQEAVRRLEATAERPWNDELKDKLFWVAIGCASVAAFAGRVLRRTAVAVCQGQLPATSGVPGSRTGTAADGAAALLAQLTAPELAAALAGLFESVRRSSPPATVSATSREGVTAALAAQSLDAFSAAPGWVAAANEAALTLSNFAVTRTCLLDAATAVVFRQLPGRCWRCSGWLEASSLLDAMAGAVLAMPSPPAGLPPNAVVTVGLTIHKAQLSSIKHVVACAANSLSFLGGIVPLLLATPEPNGTAPKPRALALAVGRLLAGPRVQWLQRALLERWMLDARAGVAVAEANGQPPPYDVSANDSDGEQASCGWPMLDRLSVFRLNRYALGPSASPQIEAEKDDTARLSAALTQVEPFLLTAHLAQWLTWQLQDDGPSGEPAAAGAPAAAAAVLPLSLPPLSYSMHLVCRMLEAACRLLRAGGRLGYGRWSLRLVEIAAPLALRPWAEPDGVPPDQLEAAKPAAVAAAWWGLGAVVAETRRPGDPNALSVGGRASAEVNGWKPFSCQYIQALEALLFQHATGLSVLSPAACADLATRLASCGWLRVANSLLRLHAARADRGGAAAGVPSPDQVVTATVKLLPPLLALTGLTGGGSGAGAATGKDFAGLAATLAKLASRATARVEMAMKAMEAHNELNGMGEMDIALALGEPRALAQHLALVMPDVLRRLAAAPGTGPEAAAPSGTGPEAAVPADTGAEAAATAEAAGSGAPAAAAAAAAAAEESKELRPALVALARGFVRLGGALMRAHKPLVDCAVAQLDTEDEEPVPTGGLVPASELAAMLRVAAAGAAAVEQGLAQGWLAGPRALAVAQADRLLVFALALLETMEEPAFHMLETALTAQPGLGGAAEAADMRRAQGEAAPPLAAALAAAAAHEALGADVESWLRPVPSNPQEPSWMPLLDVLKGSGGERGTELAAALRRLRLAAGRRPAGGCGSADVGAGMGAFADEASELWAARRARLGLWPGPGAPEEAQAQAAGWSGDAVVCGWVGCVNFAGESEGSLKLKRCGGCGAVRYCSAECQRADWRGGHKEQCKAAGAGAGARKGASGSR
ncbi:hypothetical protein HYH03_004571 [Edaphochlamys debaryana]|uniref:MYND-type domain-containing protein n=1 Tax=Edaphochlamys debaryana TaxID=47281 RepID=A0A835Y7D9_9CHLO|nr:hypothetical protein HYH03_004571 [Edaphochlamys debaryana]|eukprot:KAG2497416.1 hypothetical protein HYH03_004571 [Edaphochlamys debaryana]